METVNVHAAKTHFSRLLDRAQAGQEFVIAMVDTHLLLWAVASSRRLPKGARTFILDTANELFYSAASAWEVAIKSALRRRDFKANPTVLVRALAQSGFSELPVTAAHTARVAGLPALHRDRFDRLLVAQSLAEPMTLLTNDVVLAGYGPLVQLV